MFYNFRKNKKAFTLVELIVVVAIIAILGAVVGVTVSRFVDSAREKAAKSPLQSLADNWDSYKVDQPNMNLGEVVESLFPNDKSYFTLSADKWTKKLTAMKDDTFTIYFHDSNTGKYYGTLTVTKGVPNKSGVDVTETAPTGTTAWKKA